MRYGRLFSGLILVVIAVWVIVGEQITGASSDAVVNARLSTVRAPIAGTLDMPRKSFGTAIRKGDELATLNDPFVDTVRLSDLLLERAFATAEIERLAAFDAKSDGVDQVNSDVKLEVLAYRSPLKETRVGLADQDAYLTEARQRLEAIDIRIAHENTRVERLAHATVEAPTDGLLWEVLADNGEVVQRGQDILKLMVCDSALVTLSVPDNVYNRLRVGQNAKFRLDGTETLYDGTITRIAGAGAETIYRNLAVAPSIKHLERYDVALLVPELRKDTNLRCTVGQTGRVFFETRPLDWFRDIVK